MRTALVLLPLLTCQVVWGQPALRDLVDAHVHYDNDKAFLGRRWPRGSIRLDDPEPVALVDRFHDAGLVGLGELTGPLRNYDDPIYTRARITGRSCCSRPES